MEQKHENLDNHDGNIKEIVWNLGKSYYILVRKLLLYDTQQNISKEFDQQVTFTVTSTLPQSYH